MACRTLDEQSAEGADYPHITPSTDRMRTGVWWQLYPVGLRRSPGIQQTVRPPGQGLVLLYLLHAQL